MTKRIAVLGGASITAIMVGMVASMGYDPMHPKQIVHNPGRFKHVDLTNDYKKPINGYQKKQRAKKLRRKS